MYQKCTNPSELVKIIRLIGIAHLVQHIGLFTYDNVQQRIKLKQRNINARMINADGSKKENYAINSGLMVYRILSTPESRVEPKVNPDSYL